jgi:FKBP-type peptidyl-prolyl cis-trans isomerase FklB
MKRLPFLLVAFVMAGSVFVGCDGDDDDISAIINWRDNNKRWLEEKQAQKDADGKPYYEMIVPDWDPSSFVLIHYFNERTDDPNALKPIYTSTVDVRYRLELYNGVACDSSSTLTEYGPGVYRSQLSNLIDGWAAAVCNMNVGDTAEVIVPYALGYGTTSSGSVPAYSNLKFNIRLVDIYKYEASPETSNQ